MPAGNPRFKPTPTDLEGFLARKKLPLQQWLELKKIASPEGLAALLVDPAWHLTESIINKIEGLKMPAIHTMVEESAAEPVQAAVSSSNTIFEVTTKNDKDLIVEDNISLGNLVLETEVANSADSMVESIALNYNKERKKSR